MTAGIDRSSIARQVRKDFDLLQSHINANLTKDEIAVSWDRELAALTAMHATQAGLTSADEFKRYAAVYLEEQDAMFQRMVKDQAQQEQLKEVAARTLVRASIWEVFFRLFR